MTYTVPASIDEIATIVARKEHVIFLTQEDRIRIAQKIIDITEHLLETPGFDDPTLLDLTASFRCDCLEALFSEEELSKLDCDGFTEQQQIIIN